MSNIIHISEKFSIALHSLVVIANQDNKLINVKEIAKITNSSPSHLSKVMQQLVKSNFLESIRGPKGGFRLIKSPTEINFLDIYEAVEGPIILPTSCPSYNTVCPFKSCVFGGMPQKLGQEFINYLKEQKLKDFLVSID